MQQLHDQIEKYLHYCKFRKKLDKKTIKAYQIDLLQFFSITNENEDPLTKSFLTNFIESIHAKYKPKTVKRKIASLKAFINHLEFEGEIDRNPLDKIRLEFREPFVLPKILSLSGIEKLIAATHKDNSFKQSKYQMQMSIRNIAVIELLFASGLRVSELCNIRDDDIELSEGIIKVNGKGARERMIFITNPDVLDVLKIYREAFNEAITITGYFFINRLGRKLSEQSVRTIVKTYAKKAKIVMHVTPHRIRHSVATLLLEEDVDIRYIQRFLGHSSINTTQIYTFVSASKQKRIMRTKHPRNRLSV